MRPQIVAGNCYRTFVLSLAVLSLSWIEAPTAAASIVLEMDQVVGNPGDSAEMSVFLDYDPEEVKATHNGPSAITLELLYDPEKLQIHEEYFEIIALDGDGEVLQDAQGNAQASREALRLGESVHEAEKVAEYNNFPEEGRFRILIFGINNTIIAPGALLTFAVHISPQVEDHQNLMVMGDMLNSRVVDPDATDLDFAYGDGIIVTGCEGPKAPTDLQASTGLRNGVEVSWQAVQGAGITYRVYRSRENTLESALPLGDSWIDGTAFMDYTAMPADVLTHLGCNQPESLEEVTYYYWVRARSVDGCPGAFSEVASGARGAYKSAGNGAIAQGSVAGMPFVNLLVFFVVGLILWLSRNRRIATGC